MDYLECVSNSEILEIMAKYEKMHISFTRENKSIDYFLNEDWEFSGNYIGGELLQKIHLISSSSNLIIQLFEEEQTLNLIILAKLYLQGNLYNKILIVMNITGEIILSRTYAEISNEDY